MKTSKKTQTIQEIIRPLKTREMFSVSLLKGRTTKIYLGDFDTVKNAHKEFQATVEFIKKDSKILYETKMDFRFENFNFQCRNTLVNNETSYPGVIKTRSGKFQARMSVKGKKVSLGCFKTPEEAHTAYMIAKQEATLDLHNYSPFPFITKILERK